MRGFLLAVLLQPLWLFSLRAQSSQQVLQWINTVRADNQDFYVEIPFEYRNSQIVIKVTVGGQAYDYIFDTGGYNDITDEIQRKNNFPVLTTQIVGSANRLKARVNLVKVDSLSIGPLVFKDVAALQMNFEPSPTIRCTIDGALIGASLIKNYVWQIDYPDRKIIVTDRLEKLSDLHDAIKVPVAFNKRLMPFIKVRIDNRYEQCMFDLGSSTPFVLTEKAALKYSDGKQVIDVEGGSSEGGNGVVQQSLKVIKAESIDIGSIAFKNKPLLVMPVIGEPLIGNPIIKNCIVTLDFKNSALYLKPIAQSPVEEGWATFGFGMGYADGKVRVTTLYKGLAADKAGVMVNDEVAAINGQEVGYKDQCEAIQSLAALLNTKTSLTLTVLRDGGKKDIAIVKEQVF